VLKILIAEDDLASRKLLQKFLSRFGDCDVAIDGIEALDAFLSAHDEKEPYELVCLDIMMPKLDGVKVLKAIRDIENQKKVSEKDRAKIIMTTAINDQQTVLECYELGSEAYAWKPINLEKFREVLQNLNIVELS